MKYAFYLLALVVVTMTVASCKKKNNPVIVRSVVNTEDASSAADSTVYGVCGEATAMHTYNVSMSKFAKNIIKNVVIGWVVVSVECKVRNVQRTDLISQR